MNHTFIYKGRLSLNFDSLTSKSNHYYKSDGTKAEQPQPSKSVDGLEFGFMEKPGTGAFAVSVGSVILDIPLKIEPVRHTDGKHFGPKPMLFGDDSAKRLLADAILLNPHRSEDILSYVWDWVEEE